MLPQTKMLRAPENLNSERCSANPAAKALSTPGASLDPADSTALLALIVFMPHLKTEFAIFAEQQPME